MSTVLEEILHSTRAELTVRKRELPEEQLRAAAIAAPPAAGGTARGLRAALSAPGLGVIAEFKRRSPSAGALREGARVQEVVGAYERGGATALSVLTEGPYFAGSLADLEAARAAATLPILRKDFVVDPYQLYEARVAGADAVLLIVAALHPDQLAALGECARELGLDVLVEVHDERELREAAVAGAELIGVNNRDLRDFSVDVERTYRLLEQMPSGAIVVSESGISSAAQLERLRDAGVAGALVGESLMRAADSEAALRALIAGVGQGAPPVHSGPRVNL